MGNIIRAEVSEKNPYWIEKHRHYELKHFCLQYPIWKKAYSSLNGMLSRREALNAFGKARHVSNPTERIAILKHYYCAWLYYIYDSTEKGNQIKRRC